MVIYRYLRIVAGIAACFCGDKEVSWKNEKTSFHVVNINFWQLLLMKCNDKKFSISWNFDLLKFLNSEIIIKVKVDAQMIKIYLYLCQHELQVYFLTMLCEITEFWKLNLIHTGVYSFKSNDNFSMMLMSFL